MTKDNKIDFNNTKGLREWDDMDGFVAGIGRTLKVVTWGAHAWTRMNNFVLRFKTNAHRHKGHVYVCVNAMDLFDVYLTTTHGRVVKEFKDVYLEDFIDLIDNEIERIDEYAR